MPINNDPLRDKWTLRKDVMILRQVIYKELAAFKQKKAGRVQDIELTEDDKKWIDQQVVWFFSEMPQGVLDEFHKEFAAPNSSEKPKKVEEKDLEADDIY